MTIQKVHVVFKTHFDFGYTDYAEVVLKQYFDVFIPQVFDTAERLRQEGGEYRYIWTTGSWLIYQFLEQGDARNRKRMETAIEKGDITWHGLPFTFHSELMDPSLFQFGMSLRKELDRRFGKKTIAAKMTDVPGHTRGIVPILASEGIEFLHIGVNEAATPPDVPPVFKWRDPTGAEIIVMYQHAYGTSINVPGMDEALAFGFTNDNVGPHTPEEVVDVLTNLQQEYPEAEVRASTLDRFAEKLRLFRDELPVVTREIGDTWIHGVGTDPAKVAQYRALARERIQWESQPVTETERKQIDEFSRVMLCIPEHTWGMDEKTHLDDYTQYARPQFERARETERFQKFEASWEEQRAYLEQAIGKLQSSRFHDEAMDAFRKLAPVPPDLTEYEPVPDTEVVETEHFRVAIDHTRGVLSHLQTRADNRLWVSEAKPVGQISYQSYSEAEYDRYLDDYLVRRPEWGILDNSKPGIGQYGAVRGIWHPIVDAIYKKEMPEGVEFLLDLCETGFANSRYGCPGRFTVSYFFPNEEPYIEITLQWFDKPANRLPEALWFSFNLTGTAPEGWKLDKMGQEISPLDVVRNGNRKLHAVQSGLTYSDKAGLIRIETLDAPLVAPDRPSLLEFNNELPDMSGGVHFNLYNNIWGTNFPMWYDEDALFRFRLRFGDSNAAGDPRA